MLGVVGSYAFDLGEIIGSRVVGVGRWRRVGYRPEFTARRPFTGGGGRGRLGLLAGVPHGSGNGPGQGQQTEDSLHELDDSGDYGSAVVVVVGAGVVVLVVDVVVEELVVVEVVVVGGAVVVVVVVEVAVGTVVGDAVVVVEGSVVVVVVEGGTTEPLPQQLFDGFQCFHPPFEYTNQAATAVFATGS